MSTRFRLIDDKEMLGEPDQEYLIDQVCGTGSLVLTFGQSGHGKSFLGIDAAFCVATGQDWYGHAVRNRGPVVYIAAEGQPGLKDRIRAWKVHHGVEGCAVGVRFILEAVDPLNGNDMDALQMQLAALPEQQRLVVVDTWSACLAAGNADENSTKDASRAIYALRQLIEQLGVTVWIIHHQGHKSQPRPRGSSALKAAAETEIMVSQKQAVVTVTNLKQRDGAHFEDLRLQLNVVQLGENRDSCVLVPIEGGRAEASIGLPVRSRAGLSALWRLTREDFMRTADSSGGATNARWKAAADQPESTFNRARKELLQSRYVSKTGEKQETRYHVTREGLDHLHPHITSTVTSTDSDNDDHSSPPTPVTPRRGDGDGGEGSREAGEEKPPTKGTRTAA